MRRVLLSVVSAGLLLSGCVPPPPSPYASPYAPGPGYAPGYAPPGPGPEPGQPYIGPDGLTYVDGYPVDTVDGYQAEYVFLPALGGWGFYDGAHRWRGAPPGMRDRLEHAHPGGRGLPPPRDFGGGRPGPGGFRPGPGPGPGFRPGPGSEFRPGPGGMPGRPGGFPGGYPGGRPQMGGPPPGRPMGGPPGLVRPQGGPPPGRPSGPPPGAPHPNGGGRPDGRPPQ